MILVSIQLKNFRSHKDISLNFSEELNYIIGGNGQGKTSILESIYYLCTTKGHNSKSDSEVVRFNENEFEVKGFIRDITDNDVRVFYSLYENKKYYFQNSKLVSRPSEIIGKYPVVILTPADHSITQGSPADIIRFVDSVISQASETYLKTLLDYNKTLRQRSALLSSFKSQNSGTIYTGETRYAVPLDEFEAWTEKLIQGTEIINYRKNLLKLLLR
jgi:DNA replication and repair protein RecF